MSSFSAWHGLAPLAVFSGSTTPSEATHGMLSAKCLSHLCASFYLILLRDLMCWAFPFCTPFFSFYALSLCLLLPSAYSFHSSVALGPLLVPPPRLRTHSQHLSLVSWVELPLFC